MPDGVFLWSFDKSLLPANGTGEFFQILAPGNFAGTEFFEMRRDPLRI